MPLTLQMEETVDQEPVQKRLRHFQQNPELATARRTPGANLKRSAEDLPLMPDFCHEYLLPRDAQKRTGSL